MGNKRQQKATADNNGATMGKNGAAMIKNWATIGINGKQWGNNGVIIGNNWQQLDNWQKWTTMAAMENNLQCYIYLRCLYCWQSVHILDPCEIRTQYLLRQQSTVWLINVQAYILCAIGAQTSTQHHFMKFYWAMMYRCACFEKGALHCWYDFIQENKKPHNGSWGHHGFFNICHFKATSLSFKISSPAPSWCILMSTSTWTSNIPKSSLWVAATKSKLKWKIILIKSWNNDYVNYICIWSQRILYVSYSMYSKKKLWQNWFLTWIQSQAKSFWVVLWLNSCPPIFPDGGEDWRLHSQLDSVRAQWCLCSVWPTISWEKMISIPSYRKIWNLCLHINNHLNLTKVKSQTDWRIGALWWHYWTIFFGSLYLIGTSGICYLVMFAPQLGQSKRTLFSWHAALCRLRWSGLLVFWKIESMYI